MCLSTKYVGKNHVVAELLVGSHDGADWWSLLSLSPTPTATSQKKTSKLRTNSARMDLFLRGQWQKQFEWFEDEKSAPNMFCPTTERNSRSRCHHWCYYYLLMYDIYVQQSFSSSSKTAAAVGQTRPGSASHPWTLCTRTPFCRVFPRSEVEIRPNLNTKNLHLIYLSDMFSPTTTERASRSRCNHYYYWWCTT